jgi:hypothetical protein
MKRIITLAILSIGASLGINNYASAQEAAVKVNVPFDFAVGTHVLPSGTYRIAAQGNFLEFDRADRKTSLFILGEPGERAQEGQQSKLVFDNVQGRYFLRKIETKSAKTSAEFPVSKLETKSKELAQSRSIYAETSSR